jgi:ankyrin repeat protein
MTGLCRETWTCVPPGLSAAEADRVRVRTGHPIWSRIISMRHGESKETRLSWAARKCKLARVRELCEWRADIEAADKYGFTPLHNASIFRHLDVVRELLARGAVVDVAFNTGATPLILASYFGITEVVRVLLAAGANKRHVDNGGDTADSVAGAADGAPAGSRAAILALLAAAP